MSGSATHEDSDHKLVECPYCLSRISPRAQVCRFCSRDVARLIEAESQVRLLEEQVVPTGEQQGSHRRASSAWLVLLIFYIVSITTTLVLGRPQVGEGQTGVELGVDPTLWVMTLTFLAGVVLIAVDRFRNIWLIFLGGFCQPPLEFLSMASMKMTNLIQAPQFLGDMFIHAVGLGFAMALGAILMASILQRALSAEQISVVRMFRYLEHETPLDRVGGILLRGLGVITAVVSLIYKLKGQ